MKIKLIWKLKLKEREQVSSWNESWLRDLDIGVREWKSWELSKELSEFGRYL